VEERRRIELRELEARANELTAKSIMNNANNDLNDLSPKFNGNNGLDPRPLVGVPKAIKLKAPYPFAGINVDGTSVLSYFGQMDHYLQAAGVDDKSRDSLNVAQTNLSGPALLWYQAYTMRHPNEIHCWDELKAALKVRYYPVAQEQLSMNALLNVKYRGNIEDYNNAFQTHAQMLPILNDSSFDPITMGIYIKGISGEPRTTYLVTTLNNAVQEKKAKTIFELMNIASQTEQNLRMSRPSEFINNRANPMPVVVPYVKANEQIRANTNSNNEAGNAVSTSTPVHGYTTPLANRVPAAVNHVRFADEEQFESESQDESECDNSNESDAVLKALQQFNKFCANENVLPEEFVTRRQEGSCFICGRQGHRASMCFNGKSSNTSSHPPRIHQ
jgi:hypothetical protein